MEISKETVLLTGITGFVGSWIAKEILTQGKDFKLKAMVRGISKNPYKLDALKQGLGWDLFQAIDFVEGDLENEIDLDNAIKGCQFVIHCAGVVPSNKNRSEDDFMKIAGRGTEYLVRSAIHHKVKRLVVTSSIVTIYGNLFKWPDSVSYSESDRPPQPKDLDVYTKSKLYQEDTLRQVIGGIKEIEFVTLHPSFILGPPLVCDPTSSLSAIGRFMHSVYPGYCPLYTGVVDVRDVAKAHLLALRAKGINRERIILNQESMKFGEIIEIMHNNYGHRGYKVPTRRLPYWMVWLGSYLDEQAQIGCIMYDKDLQISNQKSKELLKMDYKTDKTQMMIDMCDGLIAKGIVPDFDIEPSSWFASLFFRLA